MDQSISDNGKMDWDTEKENNYGRMEVFMKDIGMIIWHMEREDWFILMVSFMREIGKMIKVFIILYKLANGKGVYTHSDGATYEGDWVDDK